MQRVWFSKPITLYKASIKRHFVAQPIHSTPSTAAIILCRVFCRLYDFHYAASGQYWFRKSLGKIGSVEMATRHLLAAYKQTRTALNALGTIVKAPDSQRAWSMVEKICVDCGFDGPGVGIVALTDANLSIDLNHATPFFADSFDKYHRRNLHFNDPVADQIERGARMLNPEDVLKGAPQSILEGPAEGRHA
ncbi:MAG: hypothetical protein AAF280_01665 [Pseudomonadota bacterium]